jgi:hypothetical protein
MELEQKIELNKIIRKYVGGNTFILSLQKQLKTSKTLTKVEQGKNYFLIVMTIFESSICLLSCHLISLVF